MTTSNPSAGELANEISIARYLRIEGGRLLSIAEKTLIEAALRSLPAPAGAEAVRVLEEIACGRTDNGRALGGEIARQKARDILDNWPGRAALASSSTLPERVANHEDCLNCRCLPHERCSDVTSAMSGEREKDLLLRLFCKFNGDRPPLDTQLGELDALFNEVIAEHRSSLLETGFEEPK